MLIRLIPPSPHPTVLYALTFPNVLAHGISPPATVPVAWSSQLQILTSVLQLQPPPSIHMLDRAVGLVARVQQVSMDVPHKEIVVRFIDGRETVVHMNSDCVRMLSSVVSDVKGCSESESQRSSMDSGACHGSSEDTPSPIKSPKTGKHKRQRSLLFSLISSLVPKSFSSSSNPPPLGAPPPAPLPPLPHSGRVTSPTSPLKTSFSSSLPDPDHLRKRARATLVDVWRRHILSALVPQHVPAAGYIEWTLVAMAGEARSEIDSFGSNKPRGFGRTGGGRHRKTQSEGRNALDFGDRNGNFEPEPWPCRAPTPFSGISDDTERVVYPRREHTNEWGVRYVHHTGSSDEVDLFAFDYSGNNDSLLGERFTVTEDWEDQERLTFELSYMGRHNILDVDGHSSTLGDEQFRPRNISLDISDDDGNRLTDTAFDASRCPLAPSDVTEDEDSMDSQSSLRTPEYGDDLPLTLQSSTRCATYPSELSSVSRVSSSRPRSRNASAQYSSSPPTPVRISHRPLSTPSSARDFDCMVAQTEDFIASRVAYLERIYTALEMVRSRAREEGWRLVRATLIGAKNGWMDAEMEKSLEIKAKRRAWSSGIKISAPYPTPRLGSKVWGDSSMPLRSPMRPPGLTSRVPQVQGPIVPTGLALGVPERSSPLALYTWSADGQKPAPRKYGDLTSMHSVETIRGKRLSQVTFAESVTKLFPVCEDEDEIDASFEPIQVNAVGFPHAQPIAVSTEDPACGSADGPAENEDDPFYFCPSQPRTRTMSMYASSPPSTPVLPMFRPSTPLPSYRAAVCGDVFTITNCEEGRLDPSALLLQPLSSLSISPPSSRPPFIPSPSFVPRPRAVSLPTPRASSNTNKTRRTSFDYKDERYEDLSQAYASPPPDGPLVISATPAPHEQYPRYAHVQSATPTSKKSINAAVLRKTGREVVFEQGGSEFTVGIEVALGRAEEGRVVW